MPWQQERSANALFGVLTLNADGSLTLADGRLITAAEVGSGTLEAELSGVGFRISVTSDGLSVALCSSEHGVRIDQFRDGAWYAWVPGAENVPHATVTASPGARRWRRKGIACGVAAVALLATFILFAPSKGTPATPQLPTRETTTSVAPPTSSATPASEATAPRVEAPESDEIRVKKLTFSERFERKLMPLADAGSAALSGLRDAEKKFTAWAELDQYELKPSPAARKTLLALTNNAVPSANYWAVEYLRQYEDRRSEVPALRDLLIDAVSQGDPPSEQTEALFKELAKGPNNGAGVPLFGMFGCSKFPIDTIRFRDKLFDGTARASDLLEIIIAIQEAGEELKRARAWDQTLHKFVLSLGHKQRGRVIELLGVKRDIREPINWNTSPYAYKQLEDARRQVFKTGLLAGDAHAHLVLTRIHEYEEAFQRAFAAAFPSYPYRVAPVLSAERNGLGEHAPLAPITFNPDAKNEK